MLPADRKFEFSAWKMIEIRTSPTITGRSPVSPPRRRTTHALHVLGQRPGHELGRDVAFELDLVLDVVLGPAGRSGRRCRPASVMSPASGSGVRLRRAIRPTRCDEVDDALAVELARRALRDQVAEVEHRDPVGHLEHVVQVVRDDHHGQAAVGESAHQLQHPLVCATPSAAVGSSMITSREFQSTALAIATAWRCPPDSDATGWRTDRTVVTDSAGERLAGRLSPSTSSSSSRAGSAPARGTCSGRCRGCRRARGPGTRSRYRGRPRPCGVRIRCGVPSQRISPRSGRMDARHRADQDRLPGSVVTDERGDLARQGPRGSTSVNAWTGPKRLWTPRSSSSGALRRRHV